MTIPIKEVGVCIQLDYKSIVSHINIILLTIEFIHNRYFTFLRLS